MAKNDFPMKKNGFQFYLLVIISPGLGLAPPSPGGSLSRDPTAFKTVWREVNLVDAGARSDAFNMEINMENFG